MRIARGGLSRPAVELVLISSAAMLVYFLVFGARFVFLDVGPGGDTQNIWSVYWLATYSLWNFGEFLWWDPTALNGWPAYYLNHHGWATLLSPFQLAQQLLGMGIHALWPIEISRFLTLQKTLLVVAINIVGIALISRELVTTTIARCFPPLVYATCHMQFLGYVAAATVESLSAVIFLLYGLILYNNRRTPQSLLVLMLFSGVYVGSIGYMTLTSHVYPMALFSVLMFVVFPGLAGSVWTNGKLLAKTRLGAFALAGGLAFILAGVVVFLTGVSGNLPNFARLISGSLPYDINRANAWSPPDYGIVTTDVWANLFYWIPYSDLHSFTMKFDPYSSGNEYRYIGLATLPLIFIALATRLRNGYTACFAVAFFLCAAFVTLTYNNLPLSLVIEKSNIFKNIRTMALIMPRDLASLFPIFVAAIGLDAVAAGSAEREGERTRRIIDVVLIALAAIGVWSLFQLATTPAYAPIRKSLGHIGIYLLLFSGILLLAMRAESERVATGLGWALLVVAFVDLTTSASDQWTRNNGAGRYYHGRGATAMQAERQGVGPILSEAQSWPGDYYAGMVHNVHLGGPHFGLKYWLALVTRPAWQPVVDNWNPVTRMVTRYPHFKFFTNGAYVPESAIYNLDSLAPPAVEPAPRLLGSEIQFDGRRYAIVAAKAGAVESLEKSKAWPDRLAVGGTAFDEDKGEAARLILLFLGDDLWYAGSPNRSRPGAFHFEIPAPKGGAPLRVFAITRDNRAFELGYPGGYSRASAERKSAARKETRPASASQPAFYVHEASLVRPGIEGRRLHDATWELLHFGFNRVKVRATLSEPAYMVYLDNYDRHWRAYVNGERTRIHRANFAFKTVYLPAGTSEVEWVYNPIRVKIAWVVYYVLLAAAIALAVVWTRRTRR